MRRRLESPGGSSGRTFDLDAIASGSNGAQVTSTERPCRLTVTINAVRSLKRRASGPAVKDPIFSISVAGETRKSTAIRKARADEHGILDVNQSFTFDIRDAKNSILSVHVHAKGLFGMENLGQCKSLAVVDLLQEQKGEIDLKSAWYELYSKDGKKTLAGKVLMDIVAGIAEPEQKIHIFVGTWNVGNAPPGNDLSPWLPTTLVHDIVVIGSQECDYQPRAIYTDCSKDWTATLRSALGPCYKLLHAFSRGQMRLVVFVHKNAEKAVSEVQCSSEATGVANVIPNKGGLCVALKFWDTALCFVNSHLAAHDKQCEARNGNFKAIVGKLRVGLQNMDILNQFHHVFWMGDLNYRLDFEASEGEQLNPEKTCWNSVAEQIEQKKFLDYLPFDELRREQAAGRAFHSFKEGKITFAPTFKLRRDSEDIYDSKRMPAWCDRILWSSLPGCDVQVLSYSSAPEISTSDHKPVAAEFALVAHALPLCAGHSVDKDDKRWHIRFTSLRAKNLRASDNHGFSDPYISFLGPNLFQEVQTNVRLQTLNPVWNPLKDLPTIILKTFAIQRLEKEYLMVCVLDYDYTATDAVLGSGLIPLAAAVAAFKSKGRAEFNIELSHNGNPAGSLEGVMKLTWERNVAKRRFRITGGFGGKKNSLQHQLKNRILSNRMF